MLDADGLSNGHGLITVPELRGDRQSRRLNEVDQKQAKGEPLPKCRHTMVHTAFTYGMGYCEHRMLHTLSQQVGRHAKRSLVVRCHRATSRNRRVRLNPRRPAAVPRRPADS